ncbi:MAG: hypothetical protein M1546_14135 [Chloroflexi bacterium]|nr:hypothetical protein [Chloroflexota bacterium]
MVAEQLDEALARWLQRQPDIASSNYHVQVKLRSSEVEMAQLTAADLPGWVIIDWQRRGIGISLKHALAPDGKPPGIARLLEAIQADLLHTQIQIVVAPEQDWPAAYRPDSLTPDLMPVLDAGHATVLNVSAEREHGDWRIIRAYQPPSDEPITDFRF